MAALNKGAPIFWKPPDPDLIDITAQLRHEKLRWALAQQEKLRDLGSAPLTSDRPRCFKIIKVSATIASMALNST